MDAVISHQAGMRILVDPNDRSRADGPIITSKMTAEDIAKYGGIVGQGKRIVHLDVGLRIRERTSKPKGQVIKKKLIKDLLKFHINSGKADGKTIDEIVEEIAPEYGYLVNSVRALMSRWKVG